MRRKSLSAEEESAFALIAASFPGTALIYPSSTGLGKSIIDAHASLRLLMTKSGYHDYSKQEQGDANKVFRPSVIFDGESAYAYDLSLYRPDAKEGDPRFWPSILKKGRVRFPLSISRLGEGPSFAKVCAPDDLYAAIVIDGVLVMLRLTKNSFGLFSESKTNSPISGEGLAELRRWILDAIRPMSRKRVSSQKVPEDYFSYNQAHGGKRAK